MERIKVALEKAKSQQNQAVKADVDTRGDNPEQLLNDSKSASVSPAGSADASTNVTDLENLNYDQTRVIKLDPKLLEQNRIFAQNKNQIETTSIDLLRTQVLQKMTENGWKTLAITSPTPEVGKTVVSINLAISIAQHTEKTAMLADFDLKKPRIAEYLGIKNTLDKSLTDVFEKRAYIQDVIINPDLTRLVVLPTAKKVENSSEILSSSFTKNLVSDIRDRYADRIAIFDLPPILNSDDAISVMPYIDCVILVVASGLTKKVEIESSLKFLQGTNLLGVVFNKSHEVNKTYYY
jgi:protein-tyrosine kinase